MFLSEYSFDECDVPSTPFRFWNSGRRSVSFSVASVIGFPLLVVERSGIDAVRQSLLSSEHENGLDKFTRLLEGDRMAAPGQNSYGAIGCRAPDSMRVFRRGDQIVFTPDDQRGDSQARKLCPEAGIPGRGVKQRPEERIAPPLAPERFTELPAEIGRAVFDIMEASTAEIINQESASKNRL